MGFSLSVRCPQRIHYKPCPDPLERDSLRNSNPRIKNLFRNFLGRVSSSRV
jgi:hypothetical protein